MTDRVAEVLKKKRISYQDITNAIILWNPSPNGLQSSDDVLKMSDLAKAFRDEAEDENKLIKELEKGLLHPKRIFVPWEGEKENDMRKGERNTRLESVKRFLSWEKLCKGEKK